MSRHPTVKWAQRSDKLSITIELPDAKDVKLKLEPEGEFFFSATGGVDNESKASVGLRNICYLIKKAESKSWSRLLKREGKPPVFLKVDWDKWVDEDEGQDSKSGAGMDFVSLTWVVVEISFNGDEDEAEEDEGNDEGTMEEDNMVEVAGKKNIEEAAPANGEH
ncbi:hypothetical protein Acr_21g0005860 [Actinidia rufa]|uniref:Co-chaperone protein p23 n=1 Tax=Actinidia rufa TaxID=165716 RepID=A0A7J0GGP1_9ERIC|nr:hypothetical protein Acr_21g0005860 [Actinidia rufa]